MCLYRRRPEDALGWVDRGIELETEGRWPNGSAWGLPGLRRRILERLGRSGEALASAWEDYRRAPAVTSYEDLMKLVPKGERSAWHAKALASSSLTARGGGLRRSQAPTWITSPGPISSSAARIPGSSGVKASNRLLGATTTITPNLMLSSWCW